ncbi:MAG: hypothetical protein WC975_15070 [Phycisphaerae bacterium]
MRKSLVQLLMVLLIACIVSGCAQTIGTFYRLGPQSHFVYPNSNIKDLGPVKVKMRGADKSDRFPSFMTSEMDVSLYNEALKQVDGANIILDYVRKTTIKMEPSLFGQKFQTEEELEGTAARMELGKQELK